MTFLKNVATAVTVGNIFINPFSINRKEDGKQKKDSNYSVPAPLQEVMTMRISLPPCQHWRLSFSGRALLTQVSTVKKPGKKINKQASKQANKSHPKRSL